MQQCKRQREKARKQERRAQFLRRLLYSARVRTFLERQQKYTRNGPQEYVPFEHEELSIANIKDACMKYFRPRILFATSWLARAGPSCEKMAHIPNRKVFYVRFIKPEREVLSDEEGSPQCKKVRNHEDKIFAQRHTFIIMHADISDYSETSIKQSPN